MTSSHLSSAARHAVFAPLDGGGRADAVAHRLGEAIALGLIADGDQLPSESELAAQLNVSTVTLREALTALRQRGLIETRRGRGGGSFVRAPTDPSTTRLRQRLRELPTHELREIGDQHAAIAGTAARLAAERASDDNIARLRDFADRLERATSVGGRRRADGRFHIEVAAAAQSARLTRQEIDLQAEVGELLWLPLGEAVIQEDAVDQHRSLLGAIEAEDGDRARSLAEHHVDQAITRLIDFHIRLAES